MVVETIDRYIQDALEHLSDQAVYKRIEKNVFSDLHQKINTFTKHCFDCGLINHEMYSFLMLTDQPRTPFIYFLKKLHKTPISVRPIVSNINSPTVLLSRFIDTLLKPTVESKTHILRNSIQVVTEVEQLSVPSDSLLAIADVKSVYQSMNRLR